MKYAFFALLCCVTCSRAFAQKQIQVKIYQNTDYFQSRVLNSDTRETHETVNLNFNRISLAVRLQGGRTLLHEIELLIPDVTTSTRNVHFPMRYEFQEGSNFESRISTYSARYEFSKLLVPSSGKFSYSAGAGVNPYFTNTEYDPTNITRYYRSDKVVGLSVNFIPRILFKLTDRLTADFNLPVKLYDLRAVLVNIENPQIPIRQQRQNDIEHVFFEPAFTARLGLAYAF
jgi:hypothetical protein